jgi:TRAP transporter 4TM/12TM fusion protein
MPGILEHRPFSPSQVIEISYSYQGIYGVALAAVSDVVLVFVILGVALRISGAGDFFNYIAMKFTQGRRSGPAQCAIIASSLFGSVNGSAPANVSATGVLTIPMMKRAGYKAPFAGAVEATSSCVGQILPPIMGVGAFIMSEITGIPYANIMLAALIPAFLFILSLSCAVAFEAGRTGLEPIDFGRVDWTSERVAQGVTLLAGFGTLITMLIIGYAQTFCGLVATGLVLVLANAFPATRLDTSKVVQFFVDGGRDGLAVLASCAAIGIVIGAVTTTGLGIKLNQVIVALGNEQLFLALVLAGLCSIVLGMGLPTAASYIMVIFVAGPAIMELGVGLLQTHLFVFYYAVLSAITPPVALAVFAAAA